MRDIALTLIVVVGLFFALRRTWVGVLLWTWLSIMNPQRLTYGFAFSAPFAYATALITLISIPFNKKDLRLPLDPFVVLLPLLMIWMCVTTVFALDQAGSIPLLIRSLKIDLMVLVAVAAIRSRKQIELFIWVNALSIAFYGVKGGIFTIATGGGMHVWGPDDSFIQGNNELGLACVLTIPLLNYLRVVERRAWMRTALMAVMVLTALAALGSQSRGALLAIGAMALMLILRSRRKVMGTLVVAVTGVLLVAFMPASWEARMHTIDTYQQDASAMGRINAWWMCFHLANDRFLGGGFSSYDAATFAKYAPNPHDIHAAHSIYFQMLGEHGYVGLALFLILGAYSFLTAGKIRRQTKKQPEGQWAFELSSMIQVSMVGFAVGGAFLSLAYFDLPYNVLVALVACKYWLAEKRWETEPEGAFGSGAPLGRLPKPVPAAGARR
ncbi:MAG: putative O-glycosylation ligase, exosortase A system-associated [Burkholderiales bacterium]|nr:putative O-glycosylation ligase, exosortase A system-associated [Burkholderiales bacterium]